MDRYFTIMIIPEKEKGVRSFRIPRILFRTLLIIAAISLIMLGILGYDYWKIISQVYENKHLAMENRLLKEQIQLFQMKMNSLTDDMERIHIFERKLKVITGLENVDMTGGSYKKGDLEPDIPTNPPIQNGNTQKRAPQSVPSSAVPPQTQAPSAAQDQFLSAELKNLKNKESVEDNTEFKEYKKNYEEKIAANFSIQDPGSSLKEWADLTRKSVSLAADFARFDFHYSVVRNAVKSLELEVHELDQDLLDKESFLQSTPTLLPAKGWITSYYGHRLSPYAGRIKMHEGLDVGAPIGTAVLAPADGVVTFAGAKSGFGIIVQLDHGYGLETVFAHSQLARVKKGQKVKRGHIIAQVGNTGYSTGPHLHYEVRVNGTPVDPLYFILD